MRRPHLEREAKKIMSHYSRLLNGEPVAEPKEEKPEKKPEPKKAEEKKRKK